MGARRKRRQPWRGAVIIKREGKVVSSYQVLAGEQTAEQVQRDAERARRWSEGDEVICEREGDSEISGG